MIFISVGTQKFQFNRLLEDIDKLIEKKIIKEEVFAQIGHSTYLPKNYNYTRFLNQHDFHELINSCSIYVTHGGVGSIQNGLRFGKKEIVFPRFAKYKEHVDNHQIEIAKKYEELGYVKKCESQSDLEKAIINMDNFTSKYVSGRIENKVLDFIIKYIDGE